MLVLGPGLLTRLILAAPTHLLTRREARKAPRAAPKTPAPGSGRALST